MMNYNLPSDLKRESIQERKKRERQELIKNQIPQSNEFEKATFFKGNVKTGVAFAPNKKGEEKIVSALKKFSPTNLLKKAVVGVYDEAKKSYVPRSVKFTNDYLNKFDSYTNTKKHVKKSIVAGRENLNKSIKNNPYVKGIGLAYDSVKDTEIKINPNSAKLNGLPVINTKVSTITNVGKKEFDNFIFDTSALNRVLKGTATKTDYGIVALDTGLIFLPVPTSSKANLNAQEKSVKNLVDSAFQQSYKNPTNIKNIKTIDDFAKLQDSIKVQKTFNQLSAKEQKIFLKEQKEKAIDNLVKYQIAGYDSLAKKKAKKIKSIDNPKKVDEIIKDVNKSLDDLKIKNKKDKDQLIDEVDKYFKDKDKTNPFDEVLEEIQNRNFKNKMDKKSSDEIIDKNKKDSDSGGTATKTKIDKKTAKKTETKPDKKTDVPGKNKISEKTGISNLKDKAPGQTKNDEKTDKKTDDKKQDIEPKAKPKKLKETDVKFGGGLQPVKPKAKPETKLKTDVKFGGGLQPVKPKAKPEAKLKTDVQIKKKKIVKNKIKTKTDEKKKAKKQKLKLRNNQEKPEKTIKLKDGVEVVGLRSGVLETTKNLRTGKQKYGKDLSPEISNKITDPIKSFRVLKESKGKIKVKKFNIGFLEARVSNNGKRIDLFKSKRKSSGGKRRS